ncbi:MAG TPA: 30S ribosome-binding factor RbfA [Erysipelothrix sp.]|nr:30S ribosome-binding factor RbfA [Erysipelothrix sp.]
MSLKKERVESIIQRQVAKTITNELNDPALKFVSVTDVELTNDLSYATVFVSFLEEKDKVKGMEALNRAKGLLRSVVSKSLTTRRTPEILIKLDESSERGSKIDTILNKLNKED